jgi:hypothetical protein
VYDAGELVEIAMKAGRKIRGRATLAVLVCCLGLVAWTQDSSGPALGDVARKTRKDHGSAAAVAAKRVVSDEDDGPDSGGLWRERACPQTALCYELAVELPKTPKWIRATREPRPVLIPLAGYQENADHAIRVYGSESIAPAKSEDVAKRTLLQAWFARPEYFGQPAKIMRDEHVMIDGSYSGVVSHFSVTGAVVKYRGVSIVAGWAYGNFGFACAYRDDDASAASSVCDAIVNSARYNILAPPGKRRIHAEAADPPADDPQDDPPEDDDPQ